MKNRLTKEQLLSYAQHGYCTVGDLKKFIEKNNIPDDALVLIQRVEDRYYDGVDISGMSGCETSPDGKFPSGSKSTGWGVYLKKGDQFYWQEAMNQNMKEEMERIKNGEEREYPGIEDPSKFIESPGEEFMEQYHPAWSPVFYKDDPDFLFIDLHY